MRLSAKKRCTGIRSLGVSGFFMAIKNTAYFHTKTIIRRQKNMIRCLRDSNKHWVWEEDKLQQMAIEFYQKLF